MDVREDIPYYLGVLSNYVKYMETRYKILSSLSEVKQLIKACKKMGYCCNDFETNAQPIYTNGFKITILSVSFMPGFGCAIPLDHFQTDEYYASKGIEFPRRQRLKALKMIGHQLIENPKVVKCAWNFKFDGQIWEKLKIFYRGTMLDGMIMKYMLNEERPHGLKDMVRRYLPDVGDYEKAEKFDKIPWDKKELVPLCFYGCQDTDYTLRLCLFFERKLIQIGMYNTYRNLFATASRVLTSVEKCGLYLDKPFNEQLLVTYKDKIDAARDTLMNLPRVKKFTKLFTKEKVDAYTEKIQAELNELDYNDPKDARKIASREQKIANIQAGIFTTKTEQALLDGPNLNSNRDLPMMMFLHPNGFKFPVLKYTESGACSTDEDTLVQLRLTVQNPESPKAIFLDRLLELRGLEKMYKTYILGWNEKVQDDSRLHGKINIHGTDSNRYSSSEPNIQQIPKTSVDPNIKKQLIAPEGHLYLAYDYSQAELRMMAHLSGDETYLKAFREGVDPHLAIAINKYHADSQEAIEAYEDETHPDHKLWKGRRKQAKQIAFGLIYGIGPGLLAEKLSDPKAGLIVSKDEAKQIMDEFFLEHPKIKKFKDKQERFLRKHGYYRQLFGTKRRLPQIWGDDHEQQAYAIRLGLNFPCQGAAANMTNFGSVLIYWLMRQGKLPAMKECCTVHDSVYQYTLPQYINIWTVYTIWNILRNPSTKHYFGFQINDVDLSMDFSIGRTMAEELPFIPLYDYRKMLDPNFSVEEYMEEHRKWKDKRKEYGLDPTYPGNFSKIFKKEMRRYEQEFLKEHNS